MYACTQTWAAAAGYTPATLAELAAMSALPMLHFSGHPVLTKRLSPATILPVQCYVCTYQTLCCPAVHWLLRQRRLVWTHRVVFHQWCRKPHHCLGRHTFHDCAPHDLQVEPVTELRLAPHAEPAALKKAGLLRPADPSAYNHPVAATVVSERAAAQQAGEGAAPMPAGEGIGAAADREAGSTAGAANGRVSAEGAGLGSAGQGVVVDSSGMAPKAELPGEEGVHIVGGEGRTVTQPVVSEVTSGRVKVPRGGFGAPLRPA